jgi:hypothetical protein
MKCNNNSSTIDADLFIALSTSDYRLDSMNDLFTASHFCFSLCVQEADAENNIHQFVEYVAGVKSKFLSASAALIEAVQAWEAYDGALVQAAEVLSTAEKEVKNSASNYRVSCLLGEQ